jgi:ribonuclease HI
VKPPLCLVCGLSEPLPDTSFCLDCTTIRLYKFTEHTVLIVDGSWSPAHPTIGGAGIVLVDGSPTGEITGQRYCGFRCHGSQDAEYEAILRAHRWAADALIYSDEKFLVRRLQAHRDAQSTISRQVRFLRRTPHLRGAAYQRAHRLSVQGRKTLVNREMNREMNRGETGRQENEHE